MSLCLYLTLLRWCLLSGSFILNKAERRTASLTLLHQPVPASFPTWEPKGHQREGTHMRSPSLRAEPQCPSTSLPSPSPATASLLGHAGAPHPACCSHHPSSCLQASGTALSASSSGSASGARRRPWWAPCASLCSRGRSTSWAGSPRARCTTRSW